MTRASKIRRATVVFVSVSLVVMTLVACRPRRESTPIPEATPRSGVENLTAPVEVPVLLPSSIRFEQMPPEQTGVQFQYFGGPSPTHQMTEQNGGGIAVFDFDNDDSLDLFFVNGSRFGDSTAENEATNRLYRGNNAFRFQDVTDLAGLATVNFGQGCAAGDFDNDGFVDLFVAAFGRNSLWRNNGDGTFDDVTDSAGIAGSQFSSSAAWADLDGDGNLDLYVVNYLEWQPDNIARDRIPNPMSLPGQPDELYQNKGQGQFEAIGAQSGIAIASEGKGLATAIADLTNDGRLDIYVANDTQRNFLFKNQGEFNFDEVGILTGTAVSQDGSIGSSMGIAVADYNLDTLSDLFVTNFVHEPVDVLMNLGESGFAATNTELGVDSVSRSQLNFGIVCVDFDLDLWPDLFFANGHIYDDTKAGGMYRMPPALMSNVKGQQFRDASRSAGKYFGQQWLGRAVAMGDLDSDGDSDLVVSHLDDPPGILRNDSMRSGGSQRVTFVGTRSSRQPLGCRVTVLLSNGQSFALTIPSGGSFQVSHDPTLIIPTASERTIESIKIRWSNGVEELWDEWAEVPTLRLIEGRGRPCEQ